MTTGHVSNVFLRLPTLHAPLLRLSPGGSLDPSGCGEDRMGKCPPGSCLGSSPTFSITLPAHLAREGRLAVFPFTTCDLSPPPPSRKPTPPGREKALGSSGSGRAQAPSHSLLLPSPLGLAPAWPPRRRGAASASIPSAEESPAGAASQAQLPSRAADRAPSLGLTSTYVWRDMGLPKGRPGPQAT